jgi:cytochrome c biogenesis protein CcdA
MHTPGTPAHDGHVDTRRPPVAETPRMAIVGLVLAMLPMVAWGACVTETIEARQEGVFVWLVSIVLAVTGAVMGILARKHPLPSWPGEPQRRSKAALAAAIIGFITPVLSQRSVVAAML